MFRDITNYRSTGDWFYLIPAVFIVDLIVRFLAKYPGENPFFKIDALDKWYESFGVFAVASDVLSILIGIMVARYIYTALGLNGPLYFIAILLLFQLFHDLVFYVFVISPIPKGHNKMIDVFKEYGDENGVKILGADALMMLSSVAIGSLLKSLPVHWTVPTTFITLYSLCYIVFTRKPDTQT
jgi:hypothetical protein